MNLLDIEEVAARGPIESIRWDPEHGNWVVRVHHGPRGAHFGVDDAGTHAVVITVIDLE